MAIPPPNPIVHMDIERGVDAGPANSACCPWTGRTWRRIRIGTMCVTQLGALAVLIYGVAAKNDLFAYIGAGSGLVSAAIYFAYDAVCRNR